jgi:hypothetical protein
MSKSISKSEAIKIINSVEALEVLIQSIDRNDTPASKQSKLNRYIDDVKKQIKSERDLVLLSVTVK